MSPPHRTRRRRQRIVAFAMASLVTFASCTPWRTVPLTRLEIPLEVQPQRGEAPPRIRYTTRYVSDLQMMEVRAIEGPLLRGVVAEGSPPTATTVAVAVDARDLRSLEVYSQEALWWRRIGTGVGIAAGVGATVGVVVLLVALATKTSCPFVFVETPDGVRFVGEAYSGAVARPMQRDDLIPLPTLAPGVVRVRVANHAFETQYSDRLELQLVEHAADVRAVAAPDARPLLVGEARAPVAVTGLDGSARTTPTSEPDAWWESDMPTLARRDDAPLRDGLEVRFAAPPAGATPVLELDATNTHWLDLVLGRMFASFGDGLQSHLDEADRAPPERQRAWREREAVDLTVEAMVDGRWRRVTTITTPGPAALRHTAVALPRGRDGEEVRVRLTAGTGFWRIGALGLSTLRDAAPAVTHMAAATATQPDGSDGRALLAHTDGSYQALPHRGESLALTFESGEVTAGRARTAFLFANGYYRVHAQPQAVRSVPTLLRLRDEPGSMARFSLALYREMLRNIDGAPPTR